MTFIPEKKQIIVPIINFSWGVGDEIYYLNKLIDYKLKFYLYDEVIFYEFFCPIDCSIYGFRNLNNNFLNSDYFKKNKEEYYSKQLCDEDLNEDLYTRSLSKKIQNTHIFKTLCSRLNVDSKLKINFVLLNLFDKSNWEAVYVKGLGYKTFTVYNYLKKNIDENILKTILKINENFLDCLNFKHQYKVYIDLFKNDNGNFANLDCTLLKDPNFLDAKNKSIEFLQSENNRNLLTFLETGYYNHKQVLNEVSDNLQQKYITKKNNNNETLDARELEKILDSDYLHNVLIKGLYKKDISFVRDNIETDLKIELIPRYGEEQSKVSDMNLNKMFFIINRSQLVIGSEGGHMHVALFSGIPYLLVLPNVMIYNGDFYAKDSSRYKNVLLNFLFTYIFERFPIRNLFYTFEHDFITHTQYVIDRTLYQIGCNSVVNYTSCESFYKDKFIITNKNKKIKDNLIRIYQRNYINFVNDDLYYNL